MELNKHIGSEIKRIRKEKGYTMQSFADKLSVSRVTVTRYESGNLNMTTDQLQKIANALGVKVEVLFKDK